VSHRATGPMGYLFIETRRHIPSLDQLTEKEASAVGRARSRLARGLRAELEVEAAAVSAEARPFEIGDSWFSALSHQVRGRVEVACRPRGRRARVAGCDRYGQFFLSPDRTGALGGSWPTW
jgi:hypothetical protein